MNKTFLTQEGFEKLKEELEHLRNVRRKEVAERLRDAVSDGDRLGEDPEYEAAKTEQAFVEGRIRELEILLSQARIIESNGENDTIEFGSVVTIQEDDLDPEKYTIVGATEANPRKGLISNESPLGKALMGRGVGDEVEVSAPSGSFQVKVLKIE